MRAERCGLAALAGVAVPAAALAEPFRLAEAGPLPSPAAGLAWLVLLLGLLVAGAVALQRRLGWTARQTDRGALRMVSALSLGDKRALLVVDAGGERLLVGVTASRVELLCPLARCEEDGAGPRAELGDRRGGRAAGRGAGGFATLLRVALGREGRGT